MTFYWSIIIVHSYLLTVILFIIVKNHLTSYMGVFLESHMKIIRKVCNSKLSNIIVNIIRDIVIFFIYSKFLFRLRWLFHVFWVLVVANNGLVHFVCATCFRHSIVFWGILLIWCDEGLFSYYCHHNLVGRLVYLNLIVKTNSHKIYVLGYNFFDMHIELFVLYKGHIRTQTLNLSMNVLYAMR